jgi:hypothetical protein
MRSRSVSYAVALAVFFVGACEVALADYRSAVTALNPTHYWRLDEAAGGEGTIAVNATGGVNGTYAGVFEPEVAGEIGVEGPPVNIASGNLAFNANDKASVDIGPGAAMAAPTLTVAMWFKENGSQGGDRLWTNNQTDPNTSFQIFFGGGFGDTAANIGFGLNPNVNGFPTEGLPSGSGVGNFHITDTVVPVKDNQWHHIVASRNGNNIENVIVVIDGVHYGPETWADSTDTWGTTGSNAQIATRTPGDGGANQQALNGPVDEVAVWLNRQLTVAESIALYNAAIAVGPPGDFDDDGDVDGADFLVWQRDDATPEGLAEWKANFPTNAVAAINSVPEPTSLALLTICGFGGMAFRRRR